MSSESVRSVIRKYGFDALKKYLKQTSSLYLRDTGGQVEFQEMLPLLIFGPSIFFFVFRADLDFQSQLSFQYRVSEEKSLNSYTSSITTQEALLQFLASVFAMDTSGKDIIKTHKSLVFIIGTHIDQLGASANQAIAELNQHIDPVIKKNGFRDLVQYADEHEGSVIFPVDNTSESDEGFRAIRSKVNSLVSHREEFTINYPINYLLFCLELRNVKKAILPLEEFKALAARHGIVGEEVFALLCFLHLRLGVVRYFDVDGLRDIVVLEPQVLFNTITALIVKTFSCKALPSREVLEYRERGVLSTTAFECVVSTLQPDEEEMKRGIVPASTFEAIRIDGHLSPKKFLQLLVQLRIIAKFPTTEDQEEKYFIPCVLNHVPESREGDHPHTDVLPLAVKFLCQHCPKGIFGVLVIHLMAQGPGQEDHGCTTFTLMPDKIYKDQVFFTVHSTGVRDMISIKVFSSHLEIIFFPGSLEDRDLPLSTVCGNVREAIVASVEKSLLDLHYSREKLEPSTCFKCNNCSELHSVFKGKDFHKIHCEKTNETSRLPTRGRCWFNEELPSEVASSIHEDPKLKLRKGLSSSRIKQTQQELQQLQQQGSTNAVSEKSSQYNASSAGVVFQDKRKRCNEGASHGPLRKISRHSNLVADHLLLSDVSCSIEASPATPQPQPVSEAHAGPLHEVSQPTVSAEDKSSSSRCNAAEVPAAVSQTTQRRSSDGACAESPGRVSHPPVLTMADHFTVTRHLRDLNQEDLIELGEALGLYYPHLCKMNRLLKDMVASWLNREDNVQSASGDPSWTSLIKALQDIDQPGLANKIAKACLSIH